MLVYQRVDLPFHFPYHLNSRDPSTLLSILCQAPRDPGRDVTRFEASSKRKGYMGTLHKNQRKTPWKGVETPQKIGEPSPYSHCQLGRMVFPDLKNGAWETIRLPFRKANFAGGKLLRLREGAGKSINAILFLLKYLCQSDF